MLTKCKARIHNILSFTTRRISGARKLFVCGVMPAATFGADVAGISNTEFAALQAMAARTTPPRAQGAPYVAKLCF